MEDVNTVNVDISELKEKRADKVGISLYLNKENVEFIRSSFKKPLSNIVDNYFHALVDAIKEEEIKIKNKEKGENET